MSMFELAEQPYDEEDAAWDDFVAAHPHGSFLQTNRWARLKNRFGWKAQRVWLKRDGRLVAGAQILFRSAVFGLLRIGYIPHGPLVDWDDAEMVDVLLNQVDHAVYDRNAGLLKMEPLLWQSQMPPERWAALCRQHGLRANSDTIQPPRTMLLDLRPSPDDILGAMKQKTRYNVRLAARKGVTVRQGGAGDMLAFNALMRATGSRNEFGVHAPDYYRVILELFGEDAALWLAEYEGRPLATALIVRHGETAVYLAGGSSDEERQRMPSYAVQWAGIEWAKGAGCTRYDLWGLPDADAETLEAEFQKRSDGLWGVYRFKRGFGGEVCRTVGAADRVYNKRFDRLYTWWRNR